MSKIICDVCGTSYPETASQCPICGCAKSADSRTVTGNKINAEGAAASSYQFVKGGRFSKKNVIKRNKQNLARQEKRTDPDDGMDEEDSGSNKGLIVLLLILLAAIIVVVIYIAMRFFAPGTDINGPAPSGTKEPSSSSTAEPTTDPTTVPTTAPTTAPTTEPNYPCNGLTLRQTEILLGEPGSTVKISVSTDPANTTDALHFESDNEAVATVSADGTVTAVGEGSARITVTCGGYEVHCDVEVVYATSEPTTDPTTEPTTEPTTKPIAQLELNRDDITFFGEGESWKLYEGDLPLNQIEWYSGNEDVATIKNGTVTAVAPGTTKVYGKYNGEEVSCIVRCNWTSEEETTESTEGTTEPTESEVEEGIYSLYINGSVPGAFGADVTISQGESIELTVVSPSGKVVSVSWSASQSGVVAISGNTITGSGSGQVYVTALYNGELFSCIVRVN